MTPPFLQGLTVLYSRRPTQKAAVLSLGNRQMREAEYIEIAGEVFLPKLVALLPRTAVRMADTWEITPDAFQVVWDERPCARGLRVDRYAYQGEQGRPGHFANRGDRNQGTVYRPPGAECFQLPDRIHLRSGREIQGNRRSSQFAAVPTSRRESSRHEAGSSGLLSQVIVNLIDEENGRLRQTMTRDLDIERRLTPAGADSGGSPVTLLEVPASPPRRRIEFLVAVRRPGGAIPFPPSPGPRDQRRRCARCRPCQFASPNRHDELVILLKNKSEDPSGNDAFRNPAQLEQMLEDQWKSHKVEAARGPAGWLPQEPGMTGKRRIYRIESAVNTPDTDEGKGRGLRRLVIGVQTEGCVPVDDGAGRPCHVP